jgi:hypothetical protein
MLDYLKTYFTVTSLLVSSIGAVNVAVDPLWYRQGNKLTHVNMTFNERLTKTNQFLKSDRQKYDCLIFGSSRVTLLGNKTFKNNRCFNYAFAAAKPEEIAEYAEYAKERGANPKIVYVGIDRFNFHPENQKQYIPQVEVQEPPPLYQSYLFSLDTLVFSFKTIAGIAPGERYYDRNLRIRVFGDLPKYEPKLTNERSQEQCSTTRLKYYRQIRKTFPNAKIVAYVPPISAWELFNNSYARGLMDCDLEVIHEASKSFDVTYDFSYPSALTTRTDNNYDGSHYYPYVHQELAKILEGKPSDLGIRVNEYSLNEYQQFYRSKLKEFLQKQGKGDLSHVR